MNPAVAEWLKTSEGMYWSEVRIKKARGIYRSPADVASAGKDTVYTCPGFFSIKEDTELYGQGYR